MISLKPIQNLCLQTNHTVANTHQALLKEKLCYNWCGQFGEFIKYINCGNKYQTKATYKSYINPLALEMDI